MREDGKMNRAIEITVYRGQVIEVTGVPDGYVYRILDLDAKS